MTSSVWDLLTRVIFSLFLTLETGVPATKICLLLVILKTGSWPQTEEQSDSASEISPFVEGLFISGNEPVVPLFLVLELDFALEWSGDSAVFWLSGEDPFLPFGHLKSCDSRISVSQIHCNLGRAGKRAKNESLPSTANFKGALENSVKKINVKQ